MKATKAPIFIVGGQRSGNTLLGRMLSAHRDIYIKNESSDTIWAFENKQEKSEILKIILKDIGNYRSFEEALQKMKKKRWGLKDPQLIYYLDDISRFFEDAKIICLIRDGRAVGLSKIKAKFGTANIFYAANQWVEDAKILRKFYKVNKSRCCWVRYEDIIVSTEKELRKICEFIGEQFDDAMLRYYEQDGFIKTTNKLNVNTFRAPDPNIINKWQRELSNKKISVFEHVAGQDLKQNGYELVGTEVNVSAFQKFCYKLHHLIVSELQIQYQLKLKRKIQLLKQ